jgi:predicted hydrolase (HD superfamily)
MITRDQAWELLKKYNEEPFHQHHAVTVEGVMRYYAEKTGNDPDFWGLCGLLHDVDFEKWPEEHCTKAPELLAEIDTPEEIVHAVCSHGYGERSDVEPVHEMEKLLFAADELTGLIGAGIILRPSKSCKDMDVKSVKKKFKDKRFAAGCDREVIRKGAEQLGWELDQLYAEVLEAMQSMPDPDELDAQNGIA